MTGRRAGQSCYGNPGSDGVLERAQRYRGGRMAERRIDGIQWLRAVMSVFVVAWHLGGGGTSAIWTADWQKHTLTASDFSSIDSS